MKHLLLGSPKEGYGERSVSKHISFNVDWKSIFCTEGLWNELAVKCKHARWKVNVSFLSFHRDNILDPLLKWVGVGTFKEQ